MSYILNALKKAEQDRLRDDPKDLEDFASARWDPYEQKTSSNKTALILSMILLVALAVAVAIYMNGFKPLAQKTEILQSGEAVSQAIETQSIEADPYALPVLDISGHMFFAQGSKSNRLFANDQSFKEGDLVANGWRLSAIRIDGIELAKQGRSIFLAYP
ncbi:MAG: SctD/MshK family protein [Porticoccaceae bacterium]